MFLIVIAIPWSRRRAHFAALGQAAVELRHPPEEIAPYFERGQLLQTARDWWVKAARKACAAGAYPRAMTWLDRALSLWPWTESPAEIVTRMPAAGSGNPR